MDIDHNTELESSTTYESTTTIDSDDETTSSNHAIEKFVPPKINRLGSSIRGDQNYAEFVKQFQTRLITIQLDGTQEDLLNFLDHFWEKLKRERNSCFTKSKATKFLCRRINHILLSVRDINKHYIYNPSYFSKVSRILAVYMDLELKASSRGTEYGVTIIERMQYMLCSHLKSADYHQDNEFILQTFIHMERLVKSHKELVDLLFNRFIKPKSELFEAKVFSDRMYITYLVLYRKWIDIETSAEFKKKLIEMSKKHILPAQSIRKNLKYAPYLPNWTPNQNPTEVFLTNRMKFSPLIEALKIPDIEDNSDIEIVDYQNITTMQLEETQSNSDSTISLTKSFSSTSITNNVGIGGQDKIAEPCETISSIDEPITPPSSSKQPETVKVCEPIMIQPKKEPIDISLLNQDDVIDLTVDEMDVGNFEDEHLSWIGVIEPKAKCSLMLPPLNYGPRKIIEKIIVLDDDDEDDDDVEDRNTTKNPSVVDNENSSDSNLCNFLEKTQIHEISNNISGTSTGEIGNTGYSMTSPTDSGITMTNSGRNTVCSLYDEELNDERSEPKNKPTNDNIANTKSNCNNTDTEFEMETDSEIENITDAASKNSQIVVSANDNSDTQLGNNNKISNVDKLNENCDELVVNNHQNSELMQTIEPELLSESVAAGATNAETSLSQTKLRCGPTTKTYQSNKKPRPRILTPTLDVNTTAVASQIESSVNKPEITLEDNPIVLKTTKPQLNKGTQPNNTNNSSSMNTGAIIFSMLPRQKPNVPSHLSSPTTNTITPSASSNVVFSTVIPTNTAMESTKCNASSILNDWTKTEDDISKYIKDCGIDSDVEKGEIQASNILIRCDYFKTEPKSSPMRACSPSYPSIPQTTSGCDKMTSSSKTVTTNKNVYAIRRSPAGSLPFFNILEYYSIQAAKIERQQQSSSRSKRVAFANSVVEYKTEKVEDAKNDLKIRIKKKTTHLSPPRRKNESSQKSIMKRQPKPKGCSVVLNKLPESNKHVGDYIKTMKEERVASILIRRNSTHSNNQPPDQNNKKDGAYTVWRRDYVTDYDELETEQQRKTRKKKKAKRKRSRSLSEPRRSFIKKLRRQEHIIRLPPIRQFHVLVKPLNLGQLIVDPEVHIQFLNELENDNEVYNSFEINATHHLNYMSTPKSNRQSPTTDFNVVKYNAISDEHDFVEAVNNNSFASDEEIINDEHGPTGIRFQKDVADGQDPIQLDIDDNNSATDDENINDQHGPIGHHIQNVVADEPEPIEHDIDDEFIEQDAEDEPIEQDVEDESIEQDPEDEVIEQDAVICKPTEQDVEDEMIERDPEDEPNEQIILNESVEQSVEEEYIDDSMSIDQNVLLRDNETKILHTSSPESRLCEESLMISTLRLSPEPDANDDETVVSTTNEIQEEIETEIVDESMEHEIIEDSSSPADEILEPETIVSNKEVLDVSEPVSREIIISKTPECNEHEPLNVSGCSEEILDTNKIISEGSDQAPEIFLDRLNVSGNSDEITLSDTNCISEARKIAEPFYTIERMLIKKPAKVLKANSCLDQSIDSKQTNSTHLIDSKNGEGKNGRDLVEKIDDEIQIDINKNLIVVKSSPTTSGEEFLMEEYIDDEEDIVGATVDVVDLINRRSEGEQSYTSEEIPSPPFETVISKLDEKVNVIPKKMKVALTHSLNVGVPIESPPFDEVLDLKSFGTLENDSSISEMENVGKRVNDNFNEIDEEEENVLSENEIDMNVDTESSQPLDNQIITSNQNDVTTTTTALVQKKKNLIQRPYNRHIKINNKKRNSSSNSSSSDIPETIVSSTTITTNHSASIANPIEFTGTNNSNTSYNNPFCQMNYDDCTVKKRRGRPKGSKNKRKDITNTSQIAPTTFRSDNIFQYSPLSPPPPLKPVHRRATTFYQHHEITPSSPAPRPPMLYNSNPPYRPPFNASEASLNQINRNRSLPIQPFNRHHRINYRSPSWDSDEQPLIHLKQHQQQQQQHHHQQQINSATNQHGYERKHKKIKRHDSNSPPFSLEKQFGTDKDLLDATNKTYMKVQEARTIFVPEDIDKLIQNQTTVDPSMAVSPITTTYHRYDPGGDSGRGGSNNNNGGLSNCVNILNNSSLSDPITQSHQFVNYDTSSSPERILTQHEHNYSNDSFPHQLPQALLNTSSLDYLHLPYLLTAQQQFKTPLQYIHR